VAPQHLGRFRSEAVLHFSHRVGERKIERAARAKIAAAESLARLRYTLHYSARKTPVSGLFRGCRDAGDRISNAGSPTAFSQL